MKYFYSLIQTIVIALFIFPVSCTAPKMGHFKNTYPDYASKKNPRPEARETPKPEEIAVSSERVLLLSEEKVLKEALPVKNNSVKKTQEAPAVVKKTDRTDKNVSTQAAKKKQRKEIRDTLKELKTNRSGGETLLLVILAILLPPVAVLLVDGLTGPFWLSLLLTLLFYVPGLIYALFRIFRTDNT